MTGISSFSMLLQTAPAVDGPPAWTGALPLVGMVAIFFFLVMLPQMRQQKAHRNKLAALKKGDQVVTGGGLVGKVLRVDENYVDIELGANMKVKAVRATIADVLTPTGTAAND